MNLSFKISFKQKLEDINKKEEIIDLFLSNTGGIIGKRVQTKNGEKVEIHGKFRSHRYCEDNIWKGFTNYAELLFTNNNTVIYSVDILLAVMYYIFLLVIFLSVAIIGLMDKSYAGLIFFLLVFLLTTIIFISKILAHRNRFYQSISLKKKELGNYNWQEILKNKTNKELQDIISGKTALPEDVQIMAKKELNGRNH